jgi:uncharacterized membrane protein
MLLWTSLVTANVTSMTGRLNPLPYHRDHLARIEDMIAAKEAAISKQRATIRKMLREGRDVVAETNAMRANAATLRHLQSDRLVTLNLINRLAREER